MRWQAKALVQRALSGLPGGPRVNYFLQRRVTRSLPRSRADFDRHVEEAERHLAAFGDRGRPGRAFEFGAGWDLIGPLVLRASGVERQIVVDIEPHLRPELVDDALRRLGSALPAPPVTGVDDLRARFGIDYRAPCDARATGLEAESVDLISSTFTMEHIPRADLAAILRECRRLLAPDGILSSAIDYKDHFSYADPSLSPYNFLTLGDRTWRIVNSALQHQNRLRHRDYVELFEDAGLEIVSVEAEEATPADLATLASLDLAPAFRGGYSPEELGVKSARIVARPVNSASSSSAARSTV